MTQPTTTVAPANLEQYRADLTKAVREAATDAIQSRMATVDEAQAKLNERLDQIDQRVTAIAEARRSADVPGSLGGSKEEYSLTRVAVAVANGPHAYERIAPYELRVSEEAAEQMRAQGTTPDDKGGFIVPAEVHEELIIKPLKDRLMLSQLGVREMIATTTPFEVPTVEEEPDPDGANENEELGEGEIKFGQKKAEPHDLGIVIAASRRFMRMGGNADAIIRDIIVTNQARKLTRWGIKGSGIGGANPEPVGLLNTAGLGTAAYTGVDPTVPTADLYEVLLEHEEQLSLAEAFEDATNLSWLMPVVLKRALRGMKDENAAAGTASTSFARKILGDGAETALLGHPYRTWNALLANVDSEFIFGDWSKLWHIRWQGLVIEASNVADGAFKRRQTKILAWSEHDFMVEHPSAFAIATDLDLSGM